MEHFVDYTLLSRASRPHLSSELEGVAIDRTAVPVCSFATISQLFDEGADSVEAFGSFDAESSSATRRRTV